MNHLKQLSDLIEDRGNGEYDYLNLDYSSLTKYQRDCVEFASTAAPSLMEYVEGLERALRWYAKPTTYDQEWDKQFNIWVADIQCDKGKKARTALGLDGGE